MKEKGLNFIGLMGELSVYQTASLKVTEGLLYEKSQTRLRKTPLSVKFENYENPKTLEINEKIFAWAIDDYSLTKIEFCKN